MFHVCAARVLTLVLRNVTHNSLPYIILLQLPVRTYFAASWLSWIWVHIVSVFTARCTLVQSAVLRSHVVCLSVCLSVTLVNC